MGHTLFLLSSPQHLHSECVVDRACNSLVVLQLLRVNQCLFHSFIGLKTTYLGQHPRGRSLDPIPGSIGCDIYTPDRMPGHKKVHKQTYGYGQFQATM